MSRIRFFVFTLTFSFCALALIAAANAAVTETPEVVVSATRTPVEMSRIASSVTVITRKEIEQKQNSTVVELLRSVPGVTVAASGGMGQTSRVFLRGSESRHTLVMVDGIVMNDPSDPGDAFDFAYLTTDNIERIEVLRGPQSTLYGADAVSGVIQIFTRRGKGQPRIRASAEGGSFDTRRGTIGSDGAVGERFDYTIHAARLETGGISAFSEKRGGTEDDPHTNTTLTGSANVTITDNLKAGVAGRFTRGFSEFDDFGADAENRTHSDIYTLRGNAELSLFDGFWRQEFAASTGRTDRDSFAFGSLAAFDGRREGAEWLNHFKLPLNNLVTVGVEGKRESFSSNFNPQEQDMHTRSLFVQDQVSFADRVFITAGARTDDNSTFGGETTWRLTAAWHVDGPATKVKSSCGSGYKAPSLFQLFDPIFGNTTLQPEKIRGCDVGFEQMLWGDQVTFGSTVFQNDITNMIDFDFSTFKYNNVARAKMRGMENIVTVRPDMYTVLNATHTWLVAQDEVSTFALVRRPKHAFTASADRDFAEGRAHIGVALRAMGDRPDTDASFSRGTNPFFYTVGVNGSYKVNENVELYGRLENLFDRDYEEVMVYGSPGFSTFVGVRTSF